MYGRKCKMDLSQIPPGLWEDNIQKFRAVSPEIVGKALDTFTETGQEDDLALVLRMGADVDAFFKRQVPRGLGGYGESICEALLAYAVSLKNCTAVSMLLDAGADVDVVAPAWRREPALERAVSTQNLEAVNILLSAGAKSAVRVGKKKGNWGMLEILVSEGKNRPSRWGKMTLRTLCDRSGCLQGATEDSIKVMKEFVSLGADIHYVNPLYNDTLLHCAAYWGPVELV
uniref:Uncharacterized protein n=1 Tax=Chromera velia CCMP2878 TaxID=1169474 RepID=A0A0G4FR94_9ALVE|eukprot:Cvel_18215.t1-p1 / transcript=Cvel_18215.t1 / gene=Cvel_18215 / organism=Chromera_velia_CCMP2878 / gene_product=hypothetical protein / transcript_product=hypothetical protein / location=Cvel_scaffold1496:27141-27944(+) / protein_length=228 / sequence_SO=supercontig / SO=protein_coding / is_pseudo=false